MSDFRAQMTAHLEEAKRELADYPSEHRFEMAGQCDDRAGNPVEVLIVNTDPPGFLGLIMDLGNPYSFGEEGVKEDRAKLRAWLVAMANVDLTQPDVQQAVGATALMKARKVVEGFFMLSLVSSADDLLSPENGAPSPTPPLANAST